MSESRDTALGVRRVVVGADQADRRLDNFLATQWGPVPRTLIYRVIRTGEVRVNGRRARPDTRVAVGDTIRLPPLRPAETQATSPPAARLAAFERSVLVEEPGLLAVNKPAGLAVHAGSGLAWGLIDIARAARPQVARLELVHRLDRETSGCLLLAKEGQALRELNRALSEREVRKDYLALLCGRARWKHRTVTAALDIGHREGGERHARVDEEGVAAETRFEVLRRSAHWTLVRAQPATGRTHQIRVHARHLGHPLAGDPRYGDAQANAALRPMGLRRLFLHAEALEFAFRGRRYRIVAPLPEELAGLMTRLFATPESEESAP